MPIMLQHLIYNSSLILIGIFIGYLYPYIFTREKSKKIEEVTKESSTSIEDGNTKQLPPRPAAIPKHLAVIMDGNRRYGKKIYNDPLKGHWIGGQTLVDFVQWCMADGIKVLTVYAFSSENWSRDSLEIDTLMSIFTKYTETLLKEALAKNIKVVILSTDLHKLPSHIKASITKLEESTARCTGFDLNICLSYGSRTEIVQASQGVHQDVMSGKIPNIDDVTPDIFQQYLTTSRVSCDPDLIIRTSGECRLSNFLLWQSSYAELLFVDKLWPEITRTDLRHILIEYSKRQRRFGI